MVFVVVLCVSGFVWFLRRLYAVFTVVLCVFHGGIICFRGDFVELLWFPEWFLLLFM